ncbi:MULTISPECIES: hypothetical protein [Streptomyces]|uniref:hypothetical protein n=1 Tax=Streptomyces TaxID=1883 RepID=UPI0019264D5C|nr:hypothetical protein [Streptomyces sp. SID685]
MDFLTAAVLIFLIAAATVVLVVKVLASTPARIAAVLGAVAVLFGVLPRLLIPLSEPSSPAPAATVTVAPDGGDTSRGASPLAPAVVRPAPSWPQGAS